MLPYVARGGRPPAVDSSPAAAAGRLSECLHVGGPAEMGLGLGAGIAVVGRVIVAF